MFSNSEIDIGELPQYQKINYLLLSSNAPFERAVGWLIFFTFIIILSVAGILFKLPLLVEYMLEVFVVEIILMLITMYWCFYSHKFRGYALREHDILYKTGVFWRKLTILPFNRIQHIETKQGVIQRKLNLATLHLYTAGGLKADLVIRGLVSVKTEEIKQFLLLKIQQQTNQSITNDD